MIALLLALQVSVAAPAWQKLPLAHDWYGVYLNGNKVGYLEATREKNGKVLHTRQRMIARVAGMGKNVEVEVVNDFTYDWASGKLLTLAFKQGSPTGAVEVNGVAKGAKIELEFSAGGEKRALPSIDGETVAQHQAGELLAIAGKLNGKTTVKSFDASIQKATTSEVELVKIEQRMLDGVEVPIREVKSKMVELNVEEESVYTPEGRLLQSKIAGLFTLRLEDEQRAKNLGYSQDVLVAFVVPVDKLLDNPYVLNDVAISFAGAKGYPMPQSERQVVQAQGDNVRVTVKRAPFDEKSAAPLPVDTAKFAAELRPEPLLQSDAPEIRALAKEIVGGEKNSYRAAGKLLAWVHQKLEKAYVPAVSNALEVFKSRKGDCGEHAALFVALARAAGIPARPVVGITYWPPGNGFGYHAWAEVWVGRWLAVDPTQGTMSADATHVQLAGGDLAEQAKITMLIGKLKATIEKAN
ncbi:MAG: transglutaminase domain-containing protein [Deltaproteobacteria bacterium]|nr:transglutaminase domain-containing protein [Deltaproteobacteria bacterium]